MAAGPCGSLAKIELISRNGPNPTTTSAVRGGASLETDDVEAEVQRLEALGATRWDHQQERGHDFWVLRDPWANKFCVLQSTSPNSSRSAPNVA